MSRNKAPKPHNKEGIPAQAKKRTNSRTKGHNAERKYARLFREELGFDKCKTSREASTLLDSCKVDLAFIPFNIQIKKGYSRIRPKADAIFKEMDRLLGENYPNYDPQVNHPKILIHEIDGKHKHHTLITMNLEEWLPLFKAYIKNK